MSYMILENNNLYPGSLSFTNSIPKSLNDDHQSKYDAYRLTKNDIIGFMYSWCGITEVPPVRKSFLLRLHRHLFSLSLKKKNYHYGLMNGNTSFPEDQYSREYCCCWYFAFFIVERAVNYNFSYYNNDSSTTEPMAITVIVLWNGDIDYAISKFNEKLGKPIISLNHCYYEGISKESLIKSAREEIKLNEEQKGYTTSHHVRMFRS
ncbi:hypothetical protein H8356DRAFT_1332375 [Neocallimastix lanati (nom. inval.)]|nr:hypothetical protein H8356DRAFT_1351593 [Neocallimastix sp. JGI-2020a]KAG4098168.1 hypothetical protein H8356DRAFT_1332375 [Neocallimastix sp. JGI-2020a]